MIFGAFDIAVAILVFAFLGALAIWLVYQEWLDRHWNARSHSVVEDGDSRVVDFECNRGCRSRVRFKGAADRCVMVVLATSCPVMRRYAKRSGQALPPSPARVLRGRP
jgi:hypothetical protein